jgi:hypothetical protein
MLSAYGMSQATVERGRTPAAAYSEVLTRGLGQRKYLEHDAVELIHVQTG